MSQVVPSAEALLCIRACFECAVTCALTAQHCLNLGGELARSEHQSLLEDCKDICGVASRLLARGSRHASYICRACAEICIACAEDLDGLPERDEATRCAAAHCRACARACDRMALVWV